MLMKMIHTITSAPERFGTQNWDYRLSGNTLELRVKVDYEANPEAYRLGVIQIGQILQTIDREAYEEGQSSLIQSFPNIEESQLVALIRLQKLYPSDSYQTLNGSVIESKTPIGTILKSIASHYGLFFHNHIGGSLDTVRNLLESDDQIIAPGGYYYSLCTTMDNPFLWLRIGQWIERVNQLLEDTNTSSISALTYKINKEERTSLNAEFSNCSYVQALIHLVQPGVDGIDRINPRSNG
jgi:hypothetical protein